MHAKKMQIVFSTLRRVLLATLWLSISCFSIAQNPLSPALGFQLFTQSEVTFKGGTINGAVATGGNFNVNGYTSYNATTTAGTGTPYVGIGGNNYAVVTGGAFNPLTGYFIVNGSLNNWIRFGSLNGAVSGTNNAGQIKLIKNNSYLLVNSTRQTFNQVQGNGLIDFNTAFTSLKNNSASLAACTNNVSYSSLLGLTFLNLTPSKNVWNITGAQLNSFSTLYFTSLPSATKPLVINVNAPGAFTLKMPLLSGISNAQAPFIIFNFYNATSVTQTGNDMLGSVLAPNAVWVKSGTQKITGQVIAQSFTQTYGALEHAPFSTNLAGCIVCQTATSAGANQTKCNNPVFTLAANAAPTGNTGTWSVVNGTASIASVNNPTSSVTITGTSTTLRWTVSRSGCTSVSSDVVLTNNQFSSVAGTNQTQCNNAVFTLAANAAATGATGTWSVVNGTASIASVNNPTSSVTISGSTATLRWTVSRSGCTSVSSDVVLTNNQISSVAGTNQTQCNNAVFTLAANAAATGATGTWSVVNGTASIASVNNPTSSVTIFGSTATLRWTVSRSGCTSVSSDVVLTNNQISSVAGTNQTQCNNPVFTLAANSAPTGTTGAWSVVNGIADITSVNDPATPVTLTSNTATLRWTVSRSGCTDVTSDVVLSNNQVSANAGSDLSQTCSGNVLSLNATPAENGRWTLVQGNAVINNPADANSSIQVNQSPTVLRWTVSIANCVSSDEVTVSVTRPLKVVVLGSSTSYGYGASPIDSAWAYKLDAYLKSINTQSEVVNLAVPGYTSYHVLCPTGFVPESNRPDPDAAHNITAALEYQPDAIIVNLPTNDIANSYSLQEYSRNFDRTLALTNAAHIPVWVTTSQPRNTFSPEQINELLIQRDWTYTRFGTKAIDFWSTIANASNLINDIYNVDGIHVNNEGHDIFYRRVVAAGIPEAICLPWTNQAPVANAGADVQLSSPGVVTLNGGTSYDSDGVVVSYVWQQVAGSYINLGTSTQSSLALNVPYGIYQFVLTVTDDAGAAASDTVTVTVGSRILIDAGSIETTSAPDAQGKYWNNLSTAVTGSGISGLITTVNNPTSLSLDITSRIDGTFDTNGTGLYGYNPVGDVGDYPASATSDYAFAHVSATDGSWSFNGLDENSEYRFKFWGSKNADNRWIEIRKTGDVNWQSYDAGNNNVYDQAAYFTVSGQKSVRFEIRVKEGSSFGYISVVDIYATPLVSQPLENTPPVSKAGADKVIDLQTVATTLDGSGSSDSDGQIVNWQWRQISGTPVAIDQANASVAQLSNLEEGTYTFELTVTDNDGASSADTLQVSKGNRLLIDFGSIAPTSGADFLGHYWNNAQTVVTDASMENLVNVANQPTGIKFSVPARIDGDFDPTSNGLYGYNTTGTVGDYPATATSDYAYAHNSTDKGQWQLTGLDASKTYIVKFWGTKDATNRWIEIRLAGTEQWQSYDAGFNNDYNRAATVTFTGLTEATFEIRVKNGSSFGYISVVDVLEIKTSKDASLVSARRNSTGIKPAATVTVALKVAPNPSNGNFAVLIPATGIREKMSLQLVSLAGQVVYQEELNTTGNALNKQINVRPVAGVYLLKVQSAAQSWMQQIVIQ